VEFRAGNLLDFSEDLPAGFNHLDLIICRNVFIYFNKEAILKVMAKFARLTREGKIHLPYSFLPRKSLLVDGL
jgi:chemotaxis protein methyltransferase CheR